MEKRWLVSGKRSQIYIVAAIVIIAIIISLAAVSNYVTFKKSPQSFYDLGEILKLEGRQVIENTEYNQGNVNENIENYLLLYSSYLQSHINEDFNLIILYGDIESENITGKLYSRKSLGDISISFGSSDPIVMAGGEGIKVEKRSAQINPGTPRTATITISSPEDENINITQTLPILEDNNFVFVMTTNSGFNQYVQTNMKPAE